MNFDKSFDDTRAIKVLVVPIGENSMYQEQFEIVSRNKEISIVDITRPSSWKKSSPLKNFSWSKGYLNFEYMRYDRMPQGQSDMENFQSSRRILVIMGLINFPELHDDDKVERELASFAKRYPTAIVKRYFVFNYSFDATAASARKQATPFFLSHPQSDLDSIIVLPPPEGVCEGGSMIDVHVKEVMTVVCVKVVTALEEQLTTMEQAKTKGVIPSTLTSLSTPYDDIEDAIDGGAAKLQIAVKRKPQGRLRKWMGDLCLQVCSPLDAMEHYVASVSECRSLNDSFWLAGALDGYINTVLLLHKLELAPLEDLIGKDLKSISTPANASPLSDAMKVLRLAEDRIGEALLIYAKYAGYASLEVDLTLRLARLYEILAPRDDISVYGKALDYIMRAVAVTGLNPLQQLECTLEGGLMCKRLGWKRKYALFMYIAALMSAESNQLTMANDLLKKACGGYDIHVSSSNEDGCINMIVSPSDTWPSINRTLLLQSTHLAKECQEHVYAATSMSSYLKLIGKQEEQYNCISSNWNMVSDQLAKGNSSIAQLPIFYSPIISSSPLPITNDNSGSRKFSTAQVSDMAPLSEESVRSHQQKQGLTRKESISSRHSTSTPTMPIITGIPSSTGLTAASVHIMSVSVHGTGPSVFPSYRSRSHLTLTGSGMDTNSVHSVSMHGGDLTSGINNPIGNRRPYKSIFAVSQSNDSNSSQSLLSSESLVSTIRNANEGLSTELNHAKETIKQSLRNISVPNISIITPNLISFVHGDHPPRNSKSNPNSTKSTTNMGNYPHHNPNKRSPIRLRRSPERNIVKSNNSGKSKTQVDGGIYSDILNNITSFLERFCTPRDHQIQAWMMMQYLSTSIQPVASMILPITIISAKPQLLPITHRPIAYNCDTINICNKLLETMRSSSSTDTNLTNTVDKDIKKSSLFYDPFAAKRARAVATTVASCATWSVGYPGSIIIDLANPYAIPIVIDHLTVQLQGARHSVYACGMIELPSRCPLYRVEVSVLPLQEGELVLHGIIAVINNIKSYIRVDKTGRSIGCDNIMISTSINTPATNLDNIIPNTTIPVVRSSICYDVTTSGSSYRKLVDDDIMLKLYRGETKREKITLSRMKNLSFADDKLVDYKISVIWWVNRQSAASSMILSKINPIVRKSMIVKDFLAPFNSASSNNDTNDDYPIINLTYALDDDAADLTVEFELKESANQRIQVDIETLSQSEQLIMNRIQHLYHIHTSDSTSNSITTSSSSSEISSLSTSLQLYSRIYSTSYAINRSSAAIDVVQMNAISPRILHHIDPTLSPFDRIIMNTLIATINRNRIAVSSDTNANISLSILPIPRDVPLKIINKTLCLAHIRYQHDDEPGSRETSILPPQGILVDTHPLSSIDSNIPAKIDWMVDEVSTSNRLDVIQRTGSTPIILSSSVSSSLSPDIRHIDISYSQRGQPCIMYQGGQDIKITRYNSLTFKFQYHLNQSSSLEPRVLRVSVIIIEDIDLSSMDGLEVASAIPKDVMVNGSPYKTISIPADRSTMNRLDHQLTLSFLKPGKYKVFPCFQIDASSSINQNRSNDNPMSNAWFTISDKVSIEVKVKE